MHRYVHRFRRLASTVVILYGGAMTAPLAS